MAEIEIDDRLIGIVTQLSTFFMPFALPTILLVYEKDKKGGAWIMAQARKALTYQLSVIVLTILLAILAMVVTVVTLGLAAIIVLPLGIIYGIIVVLLPLYAAWKAYRGVEYDYPFITQFWQ